MPSNDTNFVSQQTVVTAAWLQDVNDTVFRVLGSGVGGIAPPNAAAIWTNTGLVNGTGDTYVGHQSTTLPSTSTLVQKKFAELGISLFDAGCVCDGVADDTAAIQTAITAIGTKTTYLIISGPTKISANLTFGGNTFLYFAPGAYFVGTSGTEVLQIQRQITAPPVKLFESCVPSATTGQTVHPEWFGATGNGSTNDLAAFQAAVYYLRNTGGDILMLPTGYVLSTNLNIPYAGINVLGAGQDVSFFILQGTTTSGIQVLGNATGPVTTNDVRLENFSIKRTTSNLGAGGTGINLFYTALAKLRNIGIYDFAISVNMVYAVNTILENVSVSFGGNAVNNPRGFNIIGDSTSVGGNKSSIFDACWVDHSLFTGVGSIGFFAYGDYISDLIFVNCETAGCDIGYNFDVSSTVAAGNEDTQLLNCRADGFITYGILINGFGIDDDSMINIVGGWLNTKNNGVDPVYGIYLNNTKNVLIDGVQFRGTDNVSYTTHVYADNALRTRVVNCAFQQGKVGFDGRSGGYAILSGNNFMASSGTPADTFVNLVGDSRTMVTGNTFGGYATYGVHADATSSGTGVTSNTFEVAHITTRVLNSSTGGIGGSDGSTGLNSGV